MIRNIKYYTMIFSKNISIHPSKLGTSLNTEVTNTVLSKFNNSCSKNFGYIYDIKDIKIKNIKVNYFTSFVDVNVVFSASSIIPAVGDKVEASVFKNIKQGVMFTTNLYKIFVPNSKNIMEGKTVSVEIVAIKYDKNQYNCIGKLIN